MLVHNKDFQRVSASLAQLKERPFPTADSSDDLLNQAYLTIFRDLGIQVREAPLSKAINSFLLVSPIRATMVVRKGGTLKTKAFACAHALAHIVRNDGRGRQWFILLDYHDEMQASAEERKLNNSAGELASALIDGVDAPRVLKIQVFRPSSTVCFGTKAFSNVLRGMV